MKKLLLRSLIVSLALVCIAPASSDCFAQVLVNNGSVVSNLGGNVIYANGGISNLSGGLFENNGSIYLTGDWSNSAGNAAFSSTASGTVLLVGGNQDIEGSSVTEFYNLVLSGSGVKQLNGIDAIVKNTLDLSDRELSTGLNTAYVTSTSLSAITRTSGFVSSLGDGTLVRSMAAVAPYFFPVGSSLAHARFRPVEVTPTTAAASAFGVRLANTEATNEGFDVYQKQSSIPFVNPLFYHRIRRDSGSALADITIYYDAPSDGDFSGIGHWQNMPRWEDVFGGSAAGNYGLNALSKKGWNDFSTPAFALTSDQCREVFVPSAFSPNGDNHNDLECVYGDCIESLSFIIYDRWGEKVFSFEGDPALSEESVCWDGTFRGKPMNTGVFVYYLQATLVGGKNITKKGNIGLVR